MSFLAKLQTEDGFWACEYGGPLFLIPGIVIMWYVVGKRCDILPTPYQVEIINYLRTTTNADGGWGL